MKRHIALISASSVLAIAVAVGGATFGSVGHAQTPAQTPVATAPVETPVASPTAQSGGGFELTVTLTSETGGRQQMIAEGAELIARFEATICAREPLDADALNGGASVTVTLQIPRGEGCGEPQAPLAIEILFPGEPRGGYLNFSTEWETGVSRSINLTIPAPINVPSQDSTPGQLPSTGSTGGEGGASNSMGLIVGGTLMLLGALSAAVYLVNQRSGRRTG
jgi:hypothetical protein